MKLSKQDINILSNVYNINKGLIINPTKSKNGKTRILSIHPNNYIVASYSLPHEFENVVTVGDMNKLMGILSSFKNPDIEFKEDYLTITEGSSNVKLIYSTMSQIYHPEDAFIKNMKYGQPLVEFKISSDELNKFIKSSHVLSLKHIRVIGDGKSVKLSAENVDNPSSDTCELQINDSDVINHGNVNVFFDKSLIDFISGNYIFKICPVKNTEDNHLLIAQNSDIDIEYMIIEDSQ